ncbi:MAG: WD40/YVTN/BNR-like repeat-containing protein [Gemmatimonadaceae bacterium]
MISAQPLGALSRRAAAALLGVALASPAAAQWQLVSVPTRAEFRGLSVAGDGTAWASGTHGTVARSTDGGASWTVDSVPGATALDLRSIVGLSAQVAVAASAGPAENGQARIFRTTDGGKTWTTAYATERKGVFLDALAFWDARHGIALSDPVDGTLFLLTSGDGGQTWTRVPSDALPPTLSGEGAFAASNTSIALWGSRDAWIGTGGAAAARVFHSADRGRTWSVSNTPVHVGGSASGIFAVAFADALHGVAVGGEYTSPHAPTVNVALTDDGGRTWRAARGPLAPAYLSGVSYAGNPGTLVAVGLAGTVVSRDGGESWISTDTLPLNVVRFGGGVGLAAGPRGRLARWTGGAGQR